MLLGLWLFFFFFFNDTATTEIYTLSLHDALPISHEDQKDLLQEVALKLWISLPSFHGKSAESRSEEHTSELQSPCNLVCRLLLEKKKKRSSYLQCGGWIGSTRALACCARPAGAVE